MLESIKSVCRAVWSIRKLDPKAREDLRVGLTPDEYRRAFDEEERNSIDAAAAKSAGKSKVEKAVEQAYEQR